VTGRHALVLGINEPSPSESGWQEYSTSPWQGAQSSFVWQRVRVTLQSVAIFENELGFRLLVTGLGRRKIPRIERHTSIVTTMQEKYLKKVCNIFFYLS
jgi:hypothetical protein